MVAGVRGVHARLAGFVVDEVMIRASRADSEPAGGAAVTCSLRNFEQVGIVCGCSGGNNLGRARRLRVLGAGT